MERPVIIVGAGICGLATAYELTRRGVPTLIIERGEPCAEQSVGLARIFRIAHRRRALCTLAMRARAGWQRWEAEFGVGRLLGSEGYGCPLGSTGDWVFGPQEPDPASVRALFPTLSPVAEVNCVTVRAPWLDAGGDGWTVARRDRITAFVGANLVKFGPLLGELLADAMSTDELPADLTAV